MATQSVAIEARIEAEEGRRETAGFWSDALWRLRRDRITMISFAVLGIFVVLALGADLIAEHVLRAKFTDQDLLRQFAKPTLDEPKYLLGGDQFGRSVAVRLLYGARVTLAVAVVAAFFQFTLGLLIGVTAGYFRGKWDDFVVWLISTLNGIPTLYLLIIVGLLFRFDPVTLALFIGFLGWTGEANLARGQTFSWKERDFVLAARTIGASPPRIMLRHIVPNILPIMIVLATITIAGVMLAESALSFIGFGIQPPTPSWGNMLTNAQSFYYKGPHLIVFPGLAISITVLCLYLIGDGLRDALDPRLRGTSSARK